MPKPLVYSGKEGAERESVDGYIADFVRYASRLRIEAYLNDDGESDANADADRYSDVTIQDAIDAMLRVQDDQQDTTTTKEDDDDRADTHPPSFVQRIAHKLKRPIHTLSQPSTAHIPTLHVTSFEKDNDSNGHVAFLTAASNLRALCYSIPPSSPLETRRIAGRIVPAMITTTALVSALSCLELVKLVQGVELGAHRNAFVNLALPFFAFTAPLGTVEREGLNGERYTIWDRIVVKEGERDGGVGISFWRVMRKVRRKVLASGSGDEGGMDDDGGDCKYILRSVPPVH